MMRRALFWLAFAPLARAERGCGEGDEGPHMDRLNEFSEIMNGFIARANEGVLDLKLWKRARRAFHRMEGIDG